MSGWSGRCGCKRCRSGGGPRSKRCCSSRGGRECRARAESGGTPVRSGVSPSPRDGDQAGVRRCHFVHDAKNGRRPGRERDSRPICDRAAECTADGRAVFRSYSISGAPSTERYRISVKREPNGVAGNYLHAARAGGRHSRCQLAAWRLHSSAGGAAAGPAECGNRGYTGVGDAARVGVDPVRPRQVFWLHAARDGAHHAFAAEAQGLVQALAHGRSYVCYSQPLSRRQSGNEFRCSRSSVEIGLDELGIPPEAEVYLCGPNRFMADMREMLGASGVARERIHVEIFNGGESMTPGMVATSRPAPHLPPNPAR